MADRSINQAGIDLIKQFEGCQLAVYADVGGLATVGYGHRCDLPIGDTITQEQADDFLSQDLQTAADGVERRILPVDDSINDNQFASLVAFTFNVGYSNFSGSTLLKDILDGNLSDVPSQFLRWDKVNGQTVAGLLRRRQAESDLWSTPV